VFAYPGAMFRVVIAILILAGCRFDLPANSGLIDAAERCTQSHDDCVCLQPPGVCVECTADDEHNCTVDKPRCGADNRCRGCRANSECASDACLENGTCATATQVVYVAPNGASTGGCGQAAGQNECSLAQAMTELSTQRPILRLAAGNYAVSGADGLDFNTKSGTVIARDATITRGPTGPVLTVRNGQSLKLVGGTLKGPSMSDGIKCSQNARLQVHQATIEAMTESGIESDTCELTVSRSTIRNNDGGGINMTSSAKVATITNNFVYRNGKGTMSPVGGMVLKVAAGSKIELNTVVDNQANTTSTSAGGIRCDHDGQAYDVPRNLIYRNTGGFDGMVQVIGMCTSNGSYKQAAAVGENAIGLERPNDSTNPSYRLTAASPPDTIRDAFDCRELDFEGDIRPAPTGGKCDFGADEYLSRQ
jgi:Right handed beta helix region